MDKRKFKFQLGRVGSEIGENITLIQADHPWKCDLKIPITFSK